MCNRSEIFHLIKELVSIIMARRRRAEVRAGIPDSKFRNEELSRFINKVMLNGKKTVAQRIVYSALDSAAGSTNQSPIDVFEQAMRNTTPAMEVKPRRVGGATYQVPVEVRSRRATMLAMRWIINSARARAGRPMAERLAQELQDASRGQGAAVRRREEMHRMAEANRAFVHYRW
jgi:small subunit ribosomal protein S7